MDEPKPILATQMISRIGPERGGGERVNGV